MSETCHPRLRAVKVGLEQRSNSADLGYLRGLAAALSTLNNDAIL